MVTINNAPRARTIYVVHYSGGGVTMRTHSRARAIAEAKDNPCGLLSVTRETWRGKRFLREVQIY